MSSCYHHTLVLTVSILGSPDILVGGPVESLDVGSEVVLHVTAALVSLLQAVELGQDVLQGLPAFSLVSIAHYCPIRAKVSQCSPKN